MTGYMKWSSIVAAVMIAGNWAYLALKPATPAKLTLEDIAIPSANELIQALWELLMPVIQ
jgi:hypothetical protein